LVFPASGSFFPAGKRAVDEALREVQPTPAFEIPREGEEHLLGVPLSTQC